MTKHKEAKQEETIETTAPAEEAAQTEETPAVAGEQEAAQQESEAEQLRQKVAELEERILRLQADFTNFRTRTAKEKEELTVFVTQKLVGDILPVLDNMERALGAQGDANALREGMDMVNRQFQAILEKNGLQPVAAVGEMFDPVRHEAVMRMEDSDKADGLVVEEFQKGYSVHGKVVRPSMVKVVANS